MALPPRILPRIGVLAGLCLLVAHLHAAPLTFDQALQAALSTHPLVQSKRSSQVAARAEREGAEWQRYPTPSIEANTQSGGQNGGKNASLLRVDQPLWTGGRITAGIEAADSRYDAAGAAIGEAARQVHAHGSDSLLHDHRISL